jgi:succinate-acetate transporter protein
LLLLPKTGYALPASGKSMGTYMLIWGIFTLGMLIATLKSSPKAT